MCIRDRDNISGSHQPFTVAEKDTAAAAMAAHWPRSGRRGLPSWPRLAAAAHPLAALGPPRLAAPAKNLNYDLVTKNIYSPQGLIDY